MAPRVEPVPMPPDGEWHAVGMERNPIPGHVDGLYRAVDWFRAEAHDLGDAVTQLREAKRSSTGKWKGDTADAFRNRIGDTPDKLALLRTRFERIADALEGFAGPLHDAQVKARKALAAATAIRADMRGDAARAGVPEDRFLRADPAPPTPDPRPDPGKKAALDRLAQQTDDLKAQIRRVHEAEHDRNEAARRCAGRIDAAGDDKLKNHHSFWHHFHFVKSVLKWANTIASWTAAIAGIAALLCAIVPPLEVLAPVFGAIALVAGSIQLSTDVAMMADGQKKLSWTTLGLDVLGVLPMAKLGALSARMGRTASVFRAARLARGAGADLTVALKDGGEGARIGEATARWIMKTHPPTRTFVNDWLNPAGVGRYVKGFTFARPASWLGRTAADAAKPVTWWRPLDGVTKVETAIGGVQWLTVNGFNPPAPVPAPFELP